MNRDPIEELRRSDRTAFMRGVALIAADTLAFSDDDTAAQSSPSERLLWPHKTLARQQFVLSAQRYVVLRQAYKMSLWAKANRFGLFDDELSGALLKLMIMAAGALNPTEQRILAACDRRRIPDSPFLSGYIGMNVVANGAPGSAYAAAENDLVNRVDVLGLTPFDDGYCSVVTGYPGPGGGG